MKLKSIIFAVAVALVVVAGFSLAQQSRDGGTTPTSGLSYWPMGGTDSTSNRVVKLDPNGILRTTEEYPYQYQTDRTSICTGDSVYLGLMYHGSWYVAPFGMRSIIVNRTFKAGGTACDPVRVYIFGSDDAANFYPVMFAPPSIAYTGDNRDTAYYDTLKFFVGSQKNNLKFTLPSNVYTGRYVGIYTRRDSTGVSSVSISVIGEGRMF